MSWSEHDSEVEAWTSSVKTRLGRQMDTPENQASKPIYDSDGCDAAIANLLKKASSAAAPHGLKFL